MGPRLLLVDDDPNILETARDILEDAGYGVETASTSAGALVALEKTPADLILVDFNLPDGTGIALAEAARKLLPQVKIILMTGEASLHLDPAGPVHDYVVKPVQPPQLLALIEKTLSRRPA